MPFKLYKILKNSPKKKGDADRWANEVVDRLNEIEQGGGEIWNEYETNQATYIVGRFPKKKKKKSSREPLSNASLADIFENAHEEYLKDRRMPKFHMLLRSLPKETIAELEGKFLQRVKEHRKTCSWCESYVFEDAVNRHLKSAQNPSLPARLAVPRWRCRRKLPKKRGDDLPGFDVQVDPVEPIVSCYNVRLAILANKSNLVSSLFSGLGCFLRGRPKKRSKILWSVWDFRCAISHQPILPK